MIRSTKRKRIFSTKVSNHTVLDLTLAFSIINDLMKDYGANWGMLDNHIALGTTDILNGDVIFDCDLIIQPENVFWSIVFHELSHLNCVKGGLLPELHDAPSPVVTELDRVLYELEVDKLAAETMNIYFPGLPYHSGYENMLIDLENALERFDKQLKKERSKTK